MVETGVSSIHKRKVLLGVIISKFNNISFTIKNKIIKGLEIYNWDNTLKRVRRRTEHKKKKQKSDEPEPDIIFDVTIRVNLYVRGILCTFI